MTRTISIEPATRLEGHVRVDIVLDDEGTVLGAYFLGTEFRGFSKICVDRPVEELPRLLTRICGVCPTAHHLAATRTLDELYGVTPPPAAERIRRLIYAAFVLEDHLLHFFVLAGPDLMMPQQTPAASRNLIGLSEVIGAQAVRAVISARKASRSIIEQLAGKVIHPVAGLPGGVSRGADEQTRTLARAASAQGCAVVDLGLEQLSARLAQHDVEDASWRCETYSMSLVDDEGHPSWLDGQLRVIAPRGERYAQFAPADYAEHIAERVVPHNFSKLPYLRQVGWRGGRDGEDSGLYRVGPLARVNVAQRMHSDEAEQQRQALFERFGGWPVHDAMATHWARLIECLDACAEIATLAEDPELTADSLRAPLGPCRSRAVGAVEAPRGTLIHDFQVDEQAIVRSVNLLIATLHNVPTINLTLERRARALLSGVDLDDGALPDEALLNQVEAAFRAYDPCVACATHSLPGQLPIVINLIGPGGTTRQLARAPNTASR